MRVRRLLRRLPLRLKLTLAFTGVMAVLFGLVGVFLYLNFEDELDYSIEQALRARAADVESLTRRGEALPPLHGPHALQESGESFVQVIDRNGRVVDSSPQAADRVLLTRAELEAAGRRTVIVDRRKRQRVLAQPVGGPSRMVVAVGVSLQQERKALKTLNGGLLIGGPLALLLASLAGYGLAAVALRPVESMRRRAATISSVDRRARLPLPDSHDEIYRLGSTLNEMLERLERASARERQFLADASHELRTPLTILKGELDMALRDGGSREDLAETLRSAAEETDRLVLLAEDLLTVARLDSGGLVLRRRSIDVGEVMGDVAARFASRGREEGRRIEVEAPRPLRAEADDDRLRQALSNLTDNALRHGEGDVTLRAQARDGTVELHVTDQGEGFPPDFLPRAFDRFSRGEAARPRGGTGLGLAIVQAIAVAHDGEALVGNRPGGGADAWLRIPHRPA